MMRRDNRRVVRAKGGCSAAGIVALLIASGCATADSGSEEASASSSAATTVTVTTTVERAPVAKPKAKRSAEHQDPPAEPFKACDANIEAKTPGTTCEFASNTFYEYFMNDETGGTLKVWSPASRQWYDTDCTAASSLVTCVASDGGMVRFGEAAVAAYDADQADRYSETHDTGPVPQHAQSVNPETPDTDAQGSGCDTNYDGCVPVSSDVDCAGGSGDGPDYVAGPVSVTGTDVYDLDRDGDGTACDS